MTMIALIHFIYNTLGQNAKHSKLWSVVKHLLLLSRGQAYIERGFSVNKDVSVENILEHNLIARCIIKDHVTFVGGLANVLVDKDLLDYVSHARKHYHAHLEIQQSEKAALERGQK